MARDAVTPVALAMNDGTAPGAGTAINVTNGAYIPAANRSQRILLHVKNTVAAAKNVTIKAGVYPPAFRQGLGDLVVQVPATSGERLFVLESARFIQADGTIWIDFEAAMTGTAFAYKLPDEAM